MTTYSIQTRQQGNWVHYTAEEDRDGAIETAKRIFGNKACTGVRVLMVQQQTNGTAAETEIHCETRVVKVTDTIRTSQIDWAPPPCVEDGEYYASTSRRLMARVLRDYCDKMVVTPTELLYNVKEANRIQDRGPLVPAAIDKVAALQGGEDAKKVLARTDEITQAIARIHSRARKAEKLALPKLKDSFHTARIACKSIETQGEDPAYVARVVLAIDLSTIRDWLGKVCRLTQLAEADQDYPDSITVLDGVIADCLAGSVVQDVLGYQPNLAQAIIAMIDLAEGSLVTEDSDAGKAAAVVNALCGKGMLPETRQSLIDRAHRQLATGGPLNRTATDKERDAFMRVRDRLTKSTGLYAGPDTAEALATRYARMLEAGGQTGRKAAFNGVFYSMPDRAASILFLCDYARTSLAEDCADDIAEKFDTILNIRSVAEMTKPGQNAAPGPQLSVKDRLQRVTNAHTAIVQSELPDRPKAMMAAHLDGMLDRFVTENQMPEKLAASKTSVKDQAMALAQFCGSGVLPKGGKAISRFVEPLAALIARPDFESSFVAGAPDAQQAERSLRAFQMFVSKLAGG